jgi:hypothetical protein
MFVLLILEKLAAAADISRIVQGSSMDSLLISLR